MQPSPRQLNAIKAVLFAACLWPLAQLSWLGWTDGLGANPIETITRASGEWALRFLLITLARAGDPDVARTATLYESRARLDLYAKAFLAQTLHLIDPADTARINTLQHLTNGGNNRMPQNLGVMLCPARLRSIGRRHSASTCSNASQWVIGNRLDICGANV